jgi:hypothetical protein
MTTQTTPRTRPQSRRKRMVRKQIYILPKQEEGLKRLAEQRGASEAELIREAIETMLQSGPNPEAKKSLPADEAAWQAILAFVDQRRQEGVTGAPYKWKREDGYDDERSRRYGW